MASLAPTRPEISPRTLFLRYVAIAVGTSAVNLLSQAGVVGMAPLAPLIVSIFIGTAVGFVLKYLLDKRYIFFDDYADRASEAKKVGLYAAVSVLTTIIFWSVEAGFWYATASQGWKYFGGAIGLAIGNVVKYRLDRKFVFKSPTP
jgi:putative flippase GtrA